MCSHAACGPLSAARASPFFDWGAQLYYPVTIVLAALSTLHCLLL